MIRFGRPLLIALTLASSSVAAQAFDIIIRGGRVADGTGNPAYFADIAIQDGRIVSVGAVEGDAAQVINATGLVVAPGFIDVHTHAEDIDELPLAENFARMGVTTVVMGNCGSSTLDVAGYFKRLEATNISINVATLIGHGSVRGKAMGGSFMRPPTAVEMDEMRGLVDRAMRDGAVGLVVVVVAHTQVGAHTDVLRIERKGLAVPLDRIRIAPGIVIEISELCAGHGIARIAIDDVAQRLHLRVVEYGRRRSPGCRARRRGRRRRFGHGRNGTGRQGCLLAADDPA